MLAGIARHARRSALLALSLPAAAALVLVVCAATAATAKVGTPPAGPPPNASAAEASTPPLLPVTVAIDQLAPGRPVPRRFLGLSFEAAALSQLAQYAHRGNLVTLLRSLGPGVLRFGGITADENVAWMDSATPRPAWASSAIGPAQLRAIGELARRSGWQVMLTVGLAHYEPVAAAREVAAAHRLFGPYLAAVEIGNEPNAYGSHGLRELPWIAQGYEEEVSNYREAIDALAPGVPIAGPDVSGSGAFSEWGGEEALSQTPALLTGHHYPLGCTQTPAPSIETLLSSASRGREALSLATYIAVARSGGVPLSIDEANTVSCGGVAGISNTFASALWATGYITQTMAAGAVSINLQGNPANCAGYTPLCAPTPTALAEGTLRAQPEWYALLLTSSLIGYRPLPTTIAAEPSPDLVAASFLGPDHAMKVVLANDEQAGASPLALRLEVGADVGIAQILRLTAPSQSATVGVRLAGRAVAANGSWREPLRTVTVATHSGVLALDLAPGSAALVTVTR
ncbi:MAG TPA: glycosyl hydrolase family 79 C-terminal domain-containing protein, partial [Solirubrobacteraceae bacterium]|nr:glycosyl hydrolase family 79 C-terminal domain-containing protein [Solirubrobacteraceae bacterium]